MIPRFQKLTTNKAYLIYWRMALSKLIQIVLEKRSIKFIVKLILFLRRKLIKVHIVYSKQYVEVTEISRYVVWSYLWCFLFWHLFGTLFVFLYLPKLGFDIVIFIRFFAMFLSGRKLNKYLNKIKWL